MDMKQALNRIASNLDLSRRASPVRGETLEMDSRTPWSQA